MTYRHTPAPWFVTDEWNPLIHSDANGGTSVAQILAYSDGITGTFRPQADADARLIAAAPELLAALRQISWLEAGDQLGSGDVAVIRAAIARATGE